MEGWYRPDSHDLQTLFPDRLTYFPTSQSVQPAWPSSTEILPMEHWLQSIALELSWKRPTVQLSHTLLAISSLKVPGWHAKQVVCASWSLKLPHVQGEQEV